MLDVVAHACNPRTAEVDKGAALEPTGQYSLVGKPQLTTDPLSKEVDSIPFLQMMPDAFLWPPYKGMHANMHTHVHTHTPLIIKACNPSTRKVEARRSGVQGQS